MSFKIGDKVKVIGNSAGHGFSMDEILTLRRRLGSTSFYVEEGREYVNETDMELIKGRGRPKKERKVMFYIKYDEYGGDPIKEIYSRKEFNEWLGEAMKNRDIKWDSILVIEPKNTYKVSSRFSLKGEKEAKK